MDRPTTIIQLYPRRVKHKSVLLHYRIIADIQRRPRPTNADRGGGGGKNQKLNTRYST